MYPGPTGSQENHRKGYCSDGVKSTMKGDTPPDWPQPQGIFELGTKFHPTNFLAALRNVYDEVVRGHSGEDLSMESQALIKLLQARLVVAEDGRHLFKLYSLELPATAPSELFLEYNGSRYMHVDYLRVME
jgi:hypothetical protein